MNENTQKEIEKLKRQKSELDILVKGKDKTIKSLKNNIEPKEPAKKAPRGRGKTKKTEEDIDKFVIENEDKLFSKDIVTAYKELSNSFL